MLKTSIFCVLNNVFYNSEITIFYLAAKRPKAPLTTLWPLLPDYMEIRSLEICSLILYLHPWVCRDILGKGPSDTV